MKTMQKLFAILALLLVPMAPRALAQNQIGQTGQLQQAVGVPWQVGGSWTFTSASVAPAAFNVKGILFYRLQFVTSGTVSGCAVSLDSASSLNSVGAPASPVIGGILPAGTIGSCAAPGAYVTSTATTPTNFGQITPTITGTGSVTVTLLGYTDNPSAAGASSAAITAPVDGAGNVKVNCAVGCSAGTPGQGTMATSQPVVIASDQSSVSVKQPTGANLHVQVDTVAAGANTIGNTYNAQTVEAAAAWTNATAGNTTLAQTVTGYGSTIVTLNQGSTITGGVVTFEASDTVAGTNWYPINATQVNGFSVSTTYTLAQSVNQAWDVDVAGWIQFRVRLSTVITGTGTVNVGIATNASSSVSDVSDGIVSILGTPPTTPGFLDVKLATAPTTPTQPIGFSSSPLGNQIAVTATAVAIASNATHEVCITALIANTIPVYVGATGETTATGFPLNAGDFYCWQVNNSNLLFLIASTTGASVAWTAQ